MVDIQDLVDRKVAERVGRDGDIWWAVVNLDSSSTKTLRLYEVAEGDLPIADVSNYLRDDSVQFVLFKVLGVDERGSVTSTRCKLILAQWIGPDVPRMKRMHASASKKAVNDYFLGHHLSLDLFDRSSGLVEKDIEARLRAAGGAHQPSRMQFSSGTKVEVITSGAPVPGAAAAASSAAPSRKASASEAAPGAEPAAAAPSPAPAPGPAAPAPGAGKPMLSPTKSSASSVSASSGVSVGSSSSTNAPNVPRARAEAQDAAAAVGKAASRLADLVAAHKGGSIPADEVAAFIESLGGASTKLLGVVGLLS